MTIERLNEISDRSRRSLLHDRRGLWHLPGQCPGCFGCCREYVEPTTQPEGPS